MQSVEYEYILKLLIPIYFEMDSDGINKYIINVPRWIFIKGKKLKPYFHWVF